jgi:alpha-1,3-rhamnosyl/mannosyltransferase
MLRVGIEAWGMSNGQRYSGFGQYTSLLLRHMPAAGIEVLAYGAPHEARPVWLPGSVEWRVPAGGVVGKLDAIESRLRCLPGLARRDGLDVFHAPAVHVRPSLPPVPRLDCPVVATVHDVIPITYYNSRLPLRLMTFYRWNLGRALASDRILTVSDAARDDIVRATNTVRERLTVIPNAVEFAPNYDSSQLWRLAVRLPYILFAGSYEPRKNLTGALEAFALLRHRQLPHSLVAIVERASGHAEVAERLIQRLHLQDHVRLVYDLDELSLSALYSYADLLLFPSLAEGFGFPPLQAAACGVPVIASDLGVIRSTMGDGVVVVDSNDHQAAADAAYGVLTDPTRRDALVARAGSRLREFEVDAFIRHHAQVYREAASAS